MTTTTTVATSTTRILPHWKEVEIQSYSVRTTTKKSGNAIARSAEIHQIGAQVSNEIFSLCPNRWLW